MAMLAIYSVLGGDFNRRGYAKRIAMASAGAVLLRLMAFQTTAAAADDSELNFLQYLLPMFVIALVGFFYFVVPALQRRRLRAAPKLRTA